jgi:hypothetical protein
MCIILLFKKTLFHCNIELFVANTVNLHIQTSNHVSILKYPSIKKYRLPEKNVLVIGCIDLRLTDDLLNFLHYDNLANRYDHFAMAGTSLCTCIDKNREEFKPEVLVQFGDFKSWRETLDHHLDLAIALHDIRDVYIVEHRSCGAYKGFLNHGEYETSQKELEAHAKFAAVLADEIHSVKRKPQKPGEKEYRLHVHCFLIDLRGNVKFLSTTNEPG